VRRSNGPPSKQPLNGQHNKLRPNEPSRWLPSVLPNRRPLNAPLSKLRPNELSKRQPSGPSKPLPKRQRNSMLLRKRPSVQRPRKRPN
jgi:hypothetical protein